MSIKVDWALLRQQKSYLLAHANVADMKDIPLIDGLVHLIDAVQDNAVNEGSASEEEVFGKPETERYYAFLDTGNAIYLGEFEEFGNADEKTPSNTVWIFSHKALKEFIESAQKAMDDDEPAPAKEAGPVATETCHHCNGTGLDPEGCGENDCRECLGLGVLPIETRKEGDS
jgi:hypothetical protein